MEAHLAGKPNDCQRPTLRATHGGGLNEGPESTMLSRMTDVKKEPAPPGKAIRWWPCVLIVALALAAIVWARTQDDWAFQKRNLAAAQVVTLTGILLLLWWTFFSSAPTRLRLGITFGAVGLAIILATMFRLRGMSGDMLPIVEFRWAKPPTPARVVSNMATNPPALKLSGEHSFPQFLGVERNGVLPGPRLETNWAKHPPEILWRQNVGPAWSGFAIVGELAVTQEQRGSEEWVIARALSTGNEVWRHVDKARYQTVIAGEGPRATPTILGDRVFTYGGTGILNCLDLATGRRLWTHNLVAESGGQIAQWGCASSPLVVGDLVIVHGGEDAPQSLHAFHIVDGEPAWSAGAIGPSYASPIVANLAGVPQVIAFNDGSVSGHAPATGAVLWEKNWGNGNVVCSSPVLVSSNRVLFSSGYGVGAELLEISRVNPGKLSARLVWKSIRMKSKFSHLFARDGFLYGLDDGIFACVNLADGSQRWKDGRYGHGQGLLVGENYLLMAESGELILLKPTPDAPNELTRFRVFNSKTWNPIALVGDLLLVRNDQEAACLRLRLAP